MFCLDNTDTLEAGASVAAVVDYTVHGLVGGLFTVIADGQLSDTDPTVIYTAAAAISIVSIIFVNTHTSAVTCNLYLDSANAGNPRRMIPKDVSLGIGYSLHLDGPRISVMNPTGGIVYSYIAHTHDGDTLQLDGINSNGGAFPFTTSEDITFTQSLVMANGKGIDFSANAHPPGMLSQLLADSQLGYWTGGLTCGTSGTITIDPNTNQLHYAKIGRLVFIGGTILTSAVDAPTGDLYLTGLPFEIAALTGQAEATNLSISFRGLGTAATLGYIPTFTAGTTQIRIRDTGDDTGTGSPFANHIDANTYLMIIGFYVAA